MVSLKELKKSPGASIFLGAILASSIIAGIVYFTSPQTMKSKEQNSIEFPKYLTNVTLKEGVIYWTYSPTCPHCQHLEDTLKKLNYSFVPVSPEETYKILAKYNYTWKGGVPIVYAKIGNKLYIIEGFPAKSQDINGYFMGKEFDLKLCKEMGGTPYYENGTYLFCILKNTTNYTVITGNVYAIEWLINKTKSED